MSRKLFVNDLLKPAYIAAAFIILSLPAIAQQGNWEQKKKTVNDLNKLLVEYNQYSSIPGKENKNAQKNIQSFIALFASNTQVPDDIVPMYLDGNTNTPFRVQQRNISEYISRIQKHFPKGVKSITQNHQIDFSGYDADGTIKVMVARTVRGITNDGFQLNNDDTLELSIRKDANAELKINEVKYLGGNFRTLNDRDLDFIIDKEDKCPDVPGLKEYKGCPPPDAPAMLYSFTLLKSISATSKTTFKSLESGYDSYISNSSLISKPQIDPASENQFGASVNLVKFLDRKRMIGIQSGLQYDFIAFDITLDQFTIQYRSVDRAGFSYRRIIDTDKSTTEQIRSHQVSIPLQGIIKGKLSSKASLYLAVGPAFSISFGSSSKPDALFDYGAIYSFNGTNNAFNPDSILATDWIMTESFAISHSSGNQNSVDKYFSDHYNSGYDIMNNVNITDKQKIKIKPAIHFLIDAGMHYKIGSTNYITAGIQVKNNVLKPKPESGYKLTDSVEDYSSLVEASEKINLNLILFKIGLAIVIR